MSTVLDRPDAPTSEAPTRRGDRFVATGLLVIAVLFAGTQVIAGEIIPPLGVATVVYAVLGAVVARRAPRWLVLAIVGLLGVHLVTSAPFLVEALAHPETPASFLPEAYIVLAVLTVAAGAVAGSRRSRLAFGGAAGVLAIMLTVASLTVAATVSPDERQPGDVPVPTAHALFPEVLEIPAGGAVLWVDNQDAYRHTLVVEDAGVHAELPGSTAVRVEVDLEPGTYTYFCDVPGHERMVGEIVAR